MPDNVIPFLPRDWRQSERAAEEKKEVSDRIRAKAMRKRLEDKKMIDRVSDRIRVAKNLGRILNEMEAKGHKRERLLRDLGKGKSGDSTKQLRNYVLAEDATAEQDSKKVHVLTKSASLYLRMAEGAAKVMESDADLIVLRLFENTSYQVADDIPDEKIASMDQLRQLLVGMAEAATRRNDLKSYLEMLRSNRIGWDINGSFGNYCSLASSPFFKDRAARHVSYLGYAPTVFLYRQDANPVTPIVGEAFQIDFEKDPDAVTGFLRESKPLPKKHRMPVSLSISRELWFGIGPIARDYTWKPIFEKRLSFRIGGHLGNDCSLHVRSYDPMIVHASVWHGWDAADRMLWLHRFSLLPRSPSGASLSISVSPHINTAGSVGCEDVQREHLEDHWLIALDGFDRQGLSVDEDIDAGEGQFFYEAVDLASCTKYLDQVADPDDWEGFENECACVELNDRLWHGYEELEAWYQDSSTEGWPAMPVSSPKGSIARAIEQNLFRDNAADRLDTVLFETVAERVQAASEYYRRVLQDREDLISGLLNSWKEA